MNSTYVNDMTEVVSNRACGYGWTEDHWINGPHMDMTWPFAAGALMSTANDLARWDQALGNEALLPAESWERMWARATLNDGTEVDYGFGWGMADYQGCRILGHDGGIPGFLASVERYLDERLSVIVLTNGVPSSPTIIARSVAGHYVPGLSPAVLNDII